MRAQHAFQGLNPEDLSFETGETFEILTADTGDGWAEVRRLSGAQETGYIPMSYVMPYDPSAPAPDIADPKSYEMVGGDFSAPEQYGAAASEQDEVWFHPNLSRQDAEQMLLHNGRQGSFLIRPSQKVIPIFFGGGF